MNSNPLTNRQLSHAEAVRRFLGRINVEAKRKPIVAHLWRSATEPMVTPEQAEELARWFLQ
jgi:hypothetical protein